MFGHRANYPVMPTINEFWKVAAQVAAERGGLVVGFAKDSKQPELGSALDNVFGFAPQSPVRVISLSDWADWVEQVEAFYRLRPGWGRGKRGDAGAHYYRVKIEGKLESGFESRFETKFDEFDARTSSAASTALNANPSSSASAIPSFAGYADPLTGFQGMPFWIRLVARLIDLMVHYLAGFVAGMLFALLLALAAGGRPPAWVLQRISQHSMIATAAAILGWIAYHVICTSVHGSTPGKLLLSMQVIQDDGSRCRPTSAILRELCFFVDAMVFGLVAYFVMRRDPQQKRLGDGWADTIVCKRAEVPPASKQAGMRFALSLALAIAADMALLMIGWLIQINS